MFRVVRALAFASLYSLALVACDQDPGAGDNPGGSLDDGGADELDGGAGSVACTVQPPTECPDPAPVYADVAPIFKQRCATCHISDWTGPWPLDTYSHIADWADTIRDMLVQCSMPPPEAGTPLPDEESEQILTWIKCKTPK